MRLALRNVLSTLVVSGAGGGAIARPVVWAAVPPIIGRSCVVRNVPVGLRNVGGTSGPWDAPRRFVAVGPYRWVRNPIYIAALLVILGEAWLFLSLALLVDAVLVAVGVHVFVVLYEERTLHRRFGAEYDLYRSKCGGGFRTRLGRRYRTREHQRRRAPSVDSDSATWCQLPERRTDARL